MLIQKGNCVVSWQQYFTQQANVNISIELSVNLQQTDVQRSFLN